MSGYFPYLSLRLLSSLHQLLDECFHHLWLLRGQTVLHLTSFPQLCLHVQTLCYCNHIVNSKNILNGYLKVDSVVFVHTCGEPIILLSFL